MYAHRNDPVEKGNVVIWERKKISAGLSPGVGESNWVPVYKREGLVLGRCRDSSSFVMWECRIYLSGLLSRLWVGS